MDFSGHSEKFRLTIVDENTSEDVLLELSLEGLKVQDRNGRMTRRKVPLDQITRWSKATDRLTMFVKTPVDIEEKAIAFYGPHSTLTSLLDTLTCYCLQLVEIMEAKEEQREAAREMRQVAKNGGRRHSKLKNADEVEFWNAPEKAGHMHSQGEVLKTWRRRWFVLKEGFLFRFLDHNVTASSKPRGIVDLSKVGDVSCGKKATGRANSIMLGQQKGHVAYLCDSETEMVEWMSALENTVQRLVRVIAGVDEDAPATGGGRGMPPPSAASENAHFLKAAEDGFRNGAGHAAPQAARQSQQPSSYSYAGSANYPGVAPLPSMPSFGSGRQEGGFQEQGRGTGGTYRNEYGVSYGLGTGTSMGGIAGVGGVRNAGPTLASSLPDTINVVGTAGQSDSTQASFGHAPAYRPGYREQQGMAEPGYGMAGYGHAPPQQQQQHHPDHYQPPVALPDTVTVASIIDEPPPRQSMYGISHQQSYPGAPPVPQQPAQWETHYAPDGRVYYFNPSTGQTQWEPPM